MPVPAQWIAALMANHRINVYSTDTLITSVIAKRNARIAQFPVGAAPLMKPLAKVTRFDPGRTATFKLIDLLLAIGEITTPPVPNFADISSTWAVLRYVWAFDIPPAGTVGRLKLSQTARELDRHQKTLLSDQMGVGMAKYVMSRFFSLHKALDVSVAVRDVNRWAAAQTFARSPDYFFYNNPTRSLFVVECKGNQSSLNETYHQLQSGSEQLPSIIFTNGRQVTSLVIGTCLAGDQTNVYVLDPPGNGDDAAEDSEKAHREGKNAWRIQAPERFQADIQRIHAAKLLAYSGDYPEALKLAAHDVPQLRAALATAPRVLSRRRNDFGTFEGTTESVVTVDGVRVRIFRGISLPTKRAAIENAEEFYEDRVIKRLSGEHGYANYTIENKSRTTVGIVSGSGAVMEISISG
jgi:hypothetical protein